MRAGHLWVFSNEVDTARTPLTAFAPGALCRVIGDKDRFLGYAYVNPHALICARILGRDPDIRARQVAARAPAAGRAGAARAAVRRAVSTGSSTANPTACRAWCSIATATWSSARSARRAWRRMKAAIVAALEQGARAAHGDLEERLAVRANSKACRRYVETRHGEAVGHGGRSRERRALRVPIGGGQKTGWFYDQAANRRALLQVRARPRVLDVFSYLGAWGLAAAEGGRERSASAWTPRRRRSRSCSAPRRRTGSPTCARSRRRLRRAGGAARGAARNSTWS